MKTFDTSASLKRGWELFKANKKALVLITLLFVIVGSIQNIKSKGDMEIELGIFPLLAILAILLYGAQLFIQLGWLKSLLKVEDGGSIQFKEIFNYGNLFWKYVAVSILYMLITAAGFILLIIPGFYFMLKYLFAPIIVIDKEVSIREAFDHSKTLTQDIKWKLLGFLIVMGLVNLLGILALGIGVLVTLPVTALALIHIYRNLGQEASPIVATAATPV